MTARLEDEQATRKRIVASAVRLHEQQGIARTSWDDIAAAAGVNRTTVYRQFRGLAELVPACARAAFEAIDLPPVEVIEAQLAGLHDVRQRVRRIVVESCACYARGAGWLRAARREADLIPELADVNRRITAGIATLLDVALNGHPIAADARTLLIVLTDYPFWQQLIDAGVDAADTPTLISTLMASLL